MPIKQIKHTPNYVHAGYMQYVIVPTQLRKHVRLAVKALTPIADKFDAIAFRGMTGALLGPPVALAMGKTLILVRKPKDDHHSDYQVEGDAGAKAYVIVDDFISEGDTARAIEAGVKKFAPKAKSLGVLEVRDAAYNMKNKKPILCKSYRGE